MLEVRRVVSGLRGRMTPHHLPIPPRPGDDRAALPLSRPRTARMGRLRCWVIRGLILAALAGVAAGGWIAHDWVSPEQVRAALVAALRDQFPDADVHVGSARLRLFGGISVTDLRLTRRGDDEPFVDAPTAVIIHDKEQLGRGRLVVRKVELDGPTVRLVRRPDGTWNVTGLSKAAARRTSRFRRSSSATRRCFSPTSGPAGCPRSR